MVITKFSVTKLFGIFSYEFTPKEDSSDFLMITGPNGYGKTTILTIIDNLAKRNLIYFYYLPFDNITIEIGDTTKIVIESEESNTESTGEDADIDNTKGRRISFEVHPKDGSISRLHLDENSLRKAIREIGYYRRSIYELRDLETKDILVDSDEILRILELIAKQQNNSDILMMLDGIMPTKYIHAQRLHTHIRNTEIRSSQLKIDNTIDIIAKNLKSMLLRKEVDYLKFSQWKDSKFIDILIKSDNKYSEEEYNNKCLALENIIEELKRFELITNINIPKYNASKAVILRAYIDELDEKLKYYNKSLEDLKLFSLLINKKKFVEKTISYSPKNGLRITTSSGKFLDVSKLSSGEQNEIIMLYNFIFDVQNHSLLLIDEPEISLHVVWQQDFVKDIIEIAKMKNLQVIIATHSPQVIGGRWKICFDLYDQDELNRSSNI